MRGIHDFILATKSPEWIIIYDISSIKMFNTLRIAVSEFNGFVFNLMSWCTNIIKRSSLLSYRFAVSSNVKNDDWYQ